MGREAEETGWPYDYATRKSITPLLAEARDCAAYMFSGFSGSTAANIKGDMRMRLDPIPV
jgi:hypothetical protein